MKKQRLKRVSSISKSIHPVSGSARICLIFVGTNVYQEFLRYHNTSLSYNLLVNYVVPL